MGSVWGAYLVFLWLVLSWKWEHRTGNLAVVGQLLANCYRGVCCLFSLFAAKVVGQSSTGIYGLAIVYVYTQPLSLLNILVHFPPNVSACFMHNCKILAQTKYLTLGDYWWLFNFYHLIPYCWPFRIPGTCSKWRAGWESRFCGLCKRLAPD